MPKNSDVKLLCADVYDKQDKNKLETIFIYLDESFRCYSLLPNKTFHTNDMFTKIKSTSLNDIANLNDRNINCYILYELQKIMNNGKKIKIKEKCAISYFYKKDVLDLSNGIGFKLAELLEKNYLTEKYNIERETIKKMLENSQIKNYVIWFLKVKNYTIIDYAMLDKMDVILYV